MTQSIKDLLRPDRYNEPAEVEIIKEFMREQFQANATVKISERQIIIGVKSAALAGALRMHVHTLAQMCQTEKRLIIRIGS